jgi:UDP-3-O-[3-hydroxymyristoyl] glucosamine N-acyltransferase
MNLSVSQILESIDYIDFIGNTESTIDKIVMLTSESINQNSISWCNDKSQDKLYSLNYGTFIVGDFVDKSKLKETCNYIVVKNPRRAFQKILEQFFVKHKVHTISKNAIIDESAVLGESNSIGNNVVIEQNCVLGDNVSIGHNTVVLQDTVIGDNVNVGSNCTLGGVGFGYEKNENGDFKQIPHVGNVVVKSNVDIGNNTCIDRAVLGSTILHENVKVDNLVHIAHGVVVQRNSVVIANSMVAGSVEIGENCWVSPSSSIINKITIGNDSLVGLGAVVLKDVEPNSVMVGNPSKKIKSNS